MTTEDVTRALVEARALGFLGPGPLDAHLASAEAFLAHLEGFEGRALDLGSGGGVPGLVLALALPSTQWVLLDIHRRRASFLQRAVIGLEVQGRVEVVHRDADLASHEPAFRESFDVVTARSFAAPAITAEIGTAFVRPGGRLLVAEPPEDVDRWPASELRALRLEREPGPQLRVAALRKIGELEPALPRRLRTIARRPAWQGFT